VSYTTEKALQDARAAVRDYLHLPKKPVLCTCRNGRGGMKQQHRSEDAALKQAINRIRSTGEAGVYRCPTSEKWHVTTHPRLTEQKGATS
jgi:hypothetical protein